MIIRDNLLALRGFREYGFGYTPQSQSLLEPSSGYTPSATLLESDKPKTSQSLVDEQGFFTVDPVLERNLSTDTYSANTQQAGTDSAVNWTGIINAAGGFVSSFFQPKQPTVVYQQPQKPLIPKWVMPAAIVGGAGLVAVAVLAKPKRSSSLSGYRRRKSRRSRR